MKKAVLLVLCCLLIWSLQIDAFSQQSDQILPPLSNTKLYINDELQSVPIYQGSDTYFQEEFVPLRACLEKLGCVVTWQAPYILIQNPSRGPNNWPPSCNTCMLVEEERISYQVYWNDDLSLLEEPWKSSRVPMNYLCIDDTIYYPLDELSHITACFLYRDDSNLYLDSEKYYKENHLIYGDIGRKANITAYINETEIDSPVYVNTSPSDVNSEIRNSFLLLRPAIESLGETVSFISPNIIMATKEDGTSYEVAKACEVINQGYKTEYDDGNYDCYIVNGTTYISLFSLMNALSGSSKMTDEHHMYVYTQDYIRIDIPATLEEAYQYLDETLDEETKAYIKEEGGTMLHMSLGLWIRNNWIYPSEDRIAKVFTNQGINEPDNMSSYILKGYHLHLQGKPCSLKDILKTK